MRFVLLLHTVIIESRVAKVRGDHVLSAQHKQASAASLQKVHSQYLLAVLADVQIIREGEAGNSWPSVLQVIFHNRPLPVRVVWGQIHSPVHRSPGHV